MNLSADMRACAQKHYRKGLATHDRLVAAVEGGDGHLSDQVALGKAEAGILRVWEQCGTPLDVEEPTPDIELQVEAFLAFKRKGLTKRIKSAKLEKTIVLCPSSKERQEMESLHTVEETIYTCQEVIFLLRGGYDLDQLSHIDHIMKVLDGELIKTREGEVEMEWELN